MQSLVNSLLSGSFKDFRSLNIEGLDASNTAYLREGDLDAAEALDTIQSGRISSDDLTWQTNDQGKPYIELAEDQWDSVVMADKCMYYDDGDSYIELGLDNLYDFDDDGNLLANTDHYWITIEGQPVAYFHTDSSVSEKETDAFTGYVPVELNGKEAHLILSLDNEENNYIAGACYDYDPSVTQTSAKNLQGLEEGDQVKFLGDAYSYKGKFLGSHQLGRTWTVKDPDNAKITYTDVGAGDTLILYKFTDIYGQNYWSREVPH